MPVSESKKLGVTVFGCRFSDKEEHVPIKKRRFLLNSLSPPRRTPSPERNETEIRTSAQHASDQICEAFMAKSQLLAIDSGPSGSSDDRDFPDNSLLVAEACSNSVGGDDKPAEEGNCMDVSQNLLCKRNDGTVRTHRPPLRDDRLHWDLNTVMDAWEHPLNSTGVDSLMTVADDICGDVEHIGKACKLEGSELQMELGGTKCSNEVTLLPSDLGDQAHETQDLNIEEHKLGELIQVPVCLHEKLHSSEINDYPKVDLVGIKKSLQGQAIIGLNVDSVVSIPPGNALGPSISADVDKNYFAQCVTFGSEGSTRNPSLLKVDCLDPGVDYTLLPKSNRCTNTCISEGKHDAVSPGLISTNNIDDCAADTKIGKAICSSSQHEKQKVEFRKDAVEVSGLHDVMPKNMVGLNTRLDQGTKSLDDIKENGDSYSDEMVSCQNSPPCLQMPALDGMSIGGQCSIAVDTEGQQNRVYEHAASVTDAYVHIDVEGPTIKSSVKSVVSSDTSVDLRSYDMCMLSSHDLGNGSEKEAVENPFDGSYDSHVSLDDPGPPLAGSEKVSNHEVDYDSEYEDGELRESVVSTWEESDGEDGETEHVDYGSDNRDGYSFDTSDCDTSTLVIVDECKKHIYSDSNDMDSEAEKFMSHVQEADFHSQGGSLVTEFIESESAEEKAVKARSLCLSTMNLEKDTIEDFVKNKNLKLDNNLAVGPDKVIGEDAIPARVDDVKASSESAELKIKLSGRDCRSAADMDSGVRNSSGRKDVVCDFVDGMDVEDNETGMGSSRSFRREFQSFVEEPASNDEYFEKDRLLMQGLRSNDADDLHSRTEKEFSSLETFQRGRYCRLVRTRGLGGGHCIDSSEGHRGLKRCHSPSYHGSAAFHRPGPENASKVAANIMNNGFGALNSTTAKADGAGSGGYAGRETTNVPAHDMRQPFIRSGSPPNRDRVLGIRMGIRPAGGMSPGRSVGRGRSIRYGLQVEGRFSRGRYYGPLSDDYIESSFNQSHPLTRRERGYFPTRGRGDPRIQRSCMKSPSRSRTRSPIDYQSPRIRNDAVGGGSPYFRRRSRSPNFRSEARMLSMRSSNRRPRFIGDQMAELMPMPRRNHAPAPHSRWIGDRMDEVIHLREQGYKQRSSVLGRRSPGRICPRGDRFDLVDAPQKLKPHGYCRSMNSGRLSDMDGVGRGRPRYEESDDDRRKRGYRYGLVQPVRHYNVDGPENGFAAAHNPCNKNTTNFHGKGSPKDCSRGAGSDVPWRCKEERGPFAYRPDGKYNVNSNSTGIQECDEDIAPRRRRPL